LARERWDSDVRKFERRVERRCIKPLDGHPSEPGVSVTQAPECHAGAKFGSLHNLREVVINGPALEGGQTRADEFVNPRYGVEVFE
jgi:hypothetical protein